MNPRLIAFPRPGCCVRFGCYLILACFTAYGVEPFAAAQPRWQETADAILLSNLKRPLLFAYDSWEKRARIEQGVLHLDATGLTPRGGGGDNLPTSRDLTTHGDDCPVLCVKTGARNMM